MLSWNKLHKNNGLSTQKNLDPFPNSIKNESEDIFRRWNIRTKEKEQPYFGSWETEQVFIDLAALRKLNRKSAWGERDSKRIYTQNLQTARTWTWKYGAEGTNMVWNSVEEGDRCPDPYHTFTERPTLYTL